MIIVNVAGHQHPQCWVDSSTCSSLQQQIFIQASSLLLTSSTKQQGSYATFRDLDTPISILKSTEHKYSGEVSKLKKKKRTLLHFQWFINTSAFNIFEEGLKNKLYLLTLSFPPLARCHLPPPPSTPSPPERIMNFQASVWLLLIYKSVSIIAAETCKPGQQFVNSFSRMSRTAQINCALMQITFLNELHIHIWILKCGLNLVSRITTEAIFSI